MEHDHEYSVLIPFTGELWFGVKAKKGLTNKEVRSIINSDFSILEKSTAMFTPSDFQKNWEDFEDIALIKDGDGNELPFIPDKGDIDYRKKVEEYLERKRSEEDE